MHVGLDEIEIDVYDQGKRGHFVRDLIFLQGLLSMLQRIPNMLIEKLGGYRRQVRRSTKAQTLTDREHDGVPFTFKRHFVLNIFIQCLWFHAGVFFSARLAETAVLPFVSGPAAGPARSAHTGKGKVSSEGYSALKRINGCDLRCRLIDSGVHAMHNDANQYINHALLVCGLVIYTVLVMWTRIWSSARFPHSVVLGFCGGIASVYAAGRLEQMSKGRALRGSAVRLTLTVLPTVAFICAVMFFIAIKAEQRLGGFSTRKEAIRVLQWFYKRRGEH